MDFAVFRWLLRLFPVEVVKNAEAELDKHETDHSKTKDLMEGIELVGLTW